MDELDYKIIEELQQNSRISYAEMGRKYNLSRVSIRERVNNLVENGVIEKFTIIVNPEEIGKKFSAFFEVEVKPNSLYKVAEKLAEEEKVINIHLMTGSASLHLHALLDDSNDFENFIREHLTKDEIVKVNSNIILKRFKTHTGGPRP